MQLDLFAEVAAAYAAAPNGRLKTAELYAVVADRMDVPSDVVNKRSPVGVAGEQYPIWKRRVRFAQQTLKQMAVLERVAGERGVWSLTESAGRKLCRAAAGVKLIAFSTELGACVWGTNTDVLGGLDEQIVLMVSSPPYPLARPRAYGGPSEAEYVEFICQALKPVVERLVLGGSIVLNLSNDVFERHSPARSTYRERLVLALRERLNLFKVSELPWVNKSKPPGPIRYASIERCHLNSAWEPVYIFTQDPHRWQKMADNRRVLVPHTEKHLRLMAGGGEKRTTSYGDGAYRLREGSFGSVTEGRIPKNVLEGGHGCADTLAYRRNARALGLPVHGAMMPSWIPSFLIEYLSEPGSLVLDIFGGTSKTGLNAERLGRRWLTIEWMLEYVRASAESFRNFPGFHLHPALSSVGELQI